MSVTGKGKPDLFEKWVEQGEVENNLAVIQSLSMQRQSLMQIAETFNMAPRTLKNLQKKHTFLKKAIERGRLTVVAMCQNKLMEKVSMGDTTAIIHALKVYGGTFFNDRKLPDVKTEASTQVQIYLPEKDPEVIRQSGKR